MPSTYAHYRFGVAMLSAMPADIQRTVKRFRRLYDVGLHGPDLFFFQNPLLRTGNLSRRFHQQTGEAFFGRICRSLRLEPSEAAFAYLYGVLAHYCLDSVCHPYVTQQVEKGNVSHVKLETEFERFLLEMDGKIPPYAQDYSGHIFLTSGECETVARFYSGAKAGQIREAVGNMAAFTKILATPQGARRKIVNQCVSLFGKQAADMVMPVEPNRQYAEHTQKLWELYQQAMAQYYEMLMQLTAHLTYNAPLGAEYGAIFG